MKILLATLLCITIIGSPFTWAEDDIDWFQVEVLIFTQSDHYQSEDNPDNITLSFPSNLVFLSDQTLHLPAGFDRLNEEDQTLYRAMIPEQQLKRSENKGPIPFQPLAKADRMLNPEAWALGRSGDYQVIYHQSWIQQLQSKNRAPWVMITAGQNRKDRHSLEGSVRFYQNRFYHVETNLWKTDFGYPQPPTESHEPPVKNWPALPPIPEYPKPQLPAFLAETLLQGDNETALSEVYEEGYALQEPDVAHHNAVINMETLKESRRIDTRGIHYIDHPRLGMLVKVIALKEQESEENTD